MGLNVIGSVGPRFKGNSLRTGIYYGPTGLTGTDATGTLVQDREYGVRFELEEAKTFSRIGIHVTIAQPASVVRLGIRQDDYGMPGTLVLDAGTVASTSTGFKEITISQPLTIGRYWLTATIQGAAGVEVKAKYSDPFIGQLAGDHANLSSIQQSGISGALPASWSSYAPDSIGAKVMLKVT